MKRHVVGVLTTHSIYCHINMSSDEVLLEEFEVLESIYPDELTKNSEREIQIDVEPESIIDGLDELKLQLAVHYPDEYPDVLPELRIEAIVGDLEDGDEEKILGDLQKTGEENLGMAMTFTLVSYLREQLTELVQQRAERKRKEEAEKERRALEEEEARTRGTPVTPESFRAWKIKFDVEMATIRKREEDEKLKAMTPKEREEYKRIATRVSGRQLFERHHNLEDEAEEEEGGVSVDFSQYDRTDRHEEEEEEHVTFSDSD